MKFQFELNHSYSYEEYFDFVQQLSNEGKTSGPNQTKALIEFTQLNHRRMKRLNKTVKLEEQTINSLTKLDTKQRWIVISEAWCGDAAQNLPAINKIAQQTEFIQLEIILRDENLEIMDAFLTNGGRSIPKLIAVNEENEVLFTWGPRPQTAQKMYTEHKSATNSESAEDFKLRLHTWYTENKSIELQRELCRLL